MKRFSTNGREKEKWKGPGRKGVVANPTLPVRCKSATLRVNNYELQVNAVFFILTKIVVYMLIAALRVKIWCVANVISWNQITKKKEKISGD